MKNRRWPATCFALALAGILALADLSWAQVGAGGGGPYCPNYQNSQYGYGGRGRSSGYQNCPNYPGYRAQGAQGAQGRGNYSKGRQGLRQGGRANTPNPQTGAPEVTP
jgi:hypothetical protein